MLKKIYVGILKVFLGPLLDERDRKAQIALGNLELPMSRIVGEQFLDARLNDVVGDLRQEIEVVKDWSQAMGDRLGLHLLCIGGEAMVGGKSVVDARSPEDLLSTALKEGDGYSVMELLRENLTPDDEAKAAK